MGTLVEEPACVLVTGFDRRLSQSQVECLAIQAFIKVGHLVAVTAERVQDLIGGHWEVKVCTFTDEEVLKLIQTYSNDTIDGSNRLKFKRILTVTSPQHIIRSMYPLKGHCQVHCNEVNDAALEVGFLLVKFPTVSYLENAVISMLNSHYRHTFPLRSFLSCYRVVMNEEVQIDTINGVQLEYLLSYIPSIEVITDPDGVKMVQKCSISNANNGEDLQTPLRSRPLPPIMRSFGHEVCQILQKQPHCQLALHKIVNEYQKSYGSPIAFNARDYGENSLYDMILRLSNMCLMMGENAGVDEYNRVLDRIHIITLQPNIQRRRFIQKITALLTGELSQSSGLLNSSTGSTMSSPQMVVPFEEIKCMLMEDSCKPSDYGAFCFDELLTQVSTSKELSRFFTLRQEDGALIPKQTLTNVTIEQACIISGLALDIQSILRKWPNASMPFHQFIPLYHHATKHQCKVEAYGVSKLEDLFNAMIDTILVFKNEHNVRSIRLTSEIIKSILLDNVHKLLLSSKSYRMTMLEMESQYMKAFCVPIIDFKLLGYQSSVHMLLSISKDTISVQDFNSNTLSVDKLSNGDFDRTVVIVLNVGTYEKTLRLKKRVLKQLLSNGKVDDFSSDYLNYLRNRHFLNKYLTMDLQLTPLGKFARACCYILNRMNGKQCDLAAFEIIYHKTFGVRLRPRVYGSLFVDRLFTFITEIVSVNDHRLQPNQRSMASQDANNRQAFSVTLNSEYEDVVIKRDSINI